MDLITFNTELSKKYVASNFIKHFFLWWNAKIVEVAATLFFFLFSETYKLTRQNPNVLELIVVILNQEFFRSKPVSYRP